ncbi:MAG: 6-pyruvoyl trahydropterin synthase family protein [Wenyingzhuangia sp.]|jgi:6-pyruvoyltetrahydropterin/6-carboxytetrahydropterin synthase|uniref:6-pyruvoyl trahydropterin synthase family protein n=1 Tax=Wenyingzhuangia sp. TaxID=1964193 RepID=UPI00321BA5DC
MEVTVHRVAYFNAAHRLFRADWDEAKNVEVFGKCSNPNYHGHNYELVVSVTGEIDSETGFVMDLKVLKKLIKSEIEEVLDHKNLNLQIPTFSTTNPTAENISIFIWDRLRKFIPTHLKLAVTLYETPRNYVTYHGK